METERKINKILLEFQSQKIDKDIALSSLDNLLKTDVPLLQSGKKRFIKKKIHVIKRLI